MWVPYEALGPLRIEGDREAAEASQRDDSSRAFLVAFFLQSPGNPDIETDFALNGEPNVGLVDAGGLRRTARLASGPTGRLSELLVSVEARGLEDALAGAWRLVAMATARWSAASGRAVTIAGWRIADLRHGARWRVAPFRPSTVPLPPILDLPLRPEHFTLLRAYQEARRSRSVSARLLFAQRIASAFDRRTEPFATTDRLAASAGLVRAEPALRRLDLVVADALGLFAEPVPSELSWKEALAALAPATRRVRDFLDPDSPPGDGTAWFEYWTEREVCAAANLADLLAHRIVCEEIRLLGELARRSEAAPVEEGTGPVGARA
ncbi:MAG: methylamine utilization protein MauJ [Geminicoccaceae bacterium]|nr:methylamine utilization protein MauJ [Geminicoccaceae bacterium]